MKNGENKKSDENFYIVDLLVSSTTTDKHIELKDIGSWHSNAYLLEKAYIGLKKQSQRYEGLHEFPAVCLKVSNGKILCLEEKYTLADYIEESAHKEGSIKLELQLGCKSNKQRVENILVKTMRNFRGSLVHNVDVSTSNFELIRLLSKCKYGETGRSRLKFVCEEDEKEERVYLITVDDEKNSLRDYLEREFKEEMKSGKCIKEITCHVLPVATWSLFTLKDWCENKGIISTTPVPEDPQVGMEKGEFYDLLLKGGLQCKEKWDPKCPIELEIDLKKMYKAGAKWLGLIDKEKRHQYVEIREYRLKEHLGLVERGTGGFDDEENCIFREKMGFHQVDYCVDPEKVPDIVIKKKFMPEEGFSEGKRYQVDFGRVCFWFHTSGVCKEKEISEEEYLRGEGKRYWGGRSCENMSELVHDMESD